MPLRLLVLLALIPLLSPVLTACYVPNVEQGNILDQETVNRVHKGMSREQVRYLLGTPMVQDAFHQDRWDYYYLLKKGRNPKPDRSRVTIVFQQDRVVKIEKQDYGTN